MSILTNFVLKLEFSLVCRLRHYIDNNSLNLLYKSLIIVPLFDYCDLVWGNCGKGLSDRLQKLQNRAARVILRADHRTNLVRLHTSLGWSFLSERRDTHLLTFVNKCLNGRVPTLQNSFNLAQNVLITVLLIGGNPFTRQT